MTGMHGRRSTVELDEQTPTVGVSDRCQICTIVQAISASTLRPCTSARAHVRPGWRYINVRRFFLMIKESIDEGTDWVDFEPNREPLQARVGDDAVQHRKWLAHVRGRSRARRAGQVRDLPDPVGLVDLQATSASARATAVRASGSHRSSSERRASSP
jgi:hypothetical protein